MIRLALNQQQDYPEKTGFPAPAERYCVQFRAFDVLRDPAPPAWWPRWGFGGGGKECRKTEGDLDEQASCKTPHRRITQGQGESPPKKRRSSADDEDYKTQERKALLFIKGAHQPSGQATLKANRPEPLRCCEPRAAPPSKC
jgi:hypothetical protein